MNEKYNDWIKKNVLDDGYGKCRIKCLEMKKEFPELAIVRGHYYDSFLGERMHWWLKNEYGTIIDPTKEQFPSKGNGVYIELDESLPEPTGKCLNCGEYCYNNDNHCSVECENESLSYYNRI